MHSDRNASDLRRWRAGYCPEEPTAADLKSCSSAMRAEGLDSSIALIQRDIDAGARLLAPGLRIRRDNAPTRHEEQISWHTYSCSADIRYKSPASCNRTYNTSSRQYFNVSDARVIAAMTTCWQHPAAHPAVAKAGWNINKVTDRRPACRLPRL